MKVQTRISGPPLEERRNRKGPFHMIFYQNFGHMHGTVHYLWGGPGREKSDRAMKMFGPK